MLNISDAIDIKELCNIKECRIYKYNKTLELYDDNSDVLDRYFIGRDVSKMKLKYIYINIFNEFDSLKIDVQNKLKSLFYGIKCDVKIWL